MHLQTSMTRRMFERYKKGLTTSRSLAVLFMSSAAPTTNIL